MLSRGLHWSCGEALVSNFAFCNMLHNSSGKTSLALQFGPFLLLMESFFKFVVGLQGPSKAEVYSLQWKHMPTCQPLSVVQAFYPCLGNYNDITRQWNINKVGAKIVCSHVWRYLYSYHISLFGQTGSVMPVTMPTFLTSCSYRQHLISGNTWRGGC